MSPLAPRARLDEAGQSIALYAITMLALALITMFTVSVGVRVRDKIKVQATADATAYGTAVSQARAMNFMAWANRAVVSEYVSALSVVGHESYLNYWEGTLQMQQQQMSGPEGVYGIQCAFCNPYCTCCCEACVSLSKANKIEKMWKDQWNDVHKIWHVNGESLHAALHNLDVAYVEGAVDNVKAGKKAFDDYEGLASGLTFADKSAKAIDDRMSATNPGRSGAGSAPANKKNWDDAVEYDPVAEDWDAYHEILAGTRTDWILKHSNFVPGMPWIEGFLQQLDIASGCDGIAISPMPGNSGGAMMDKYQSVSDIVKVNTQGSHQYNSGAAFGEGGRYALTAVNKGNTSVMMICEACEPFSYGSRSASYDQATRMDGPKGCHNDSFVNAYDGFSDGDSSAGKHYTWTDANGLAQVSGQCADQGITAGGFFRFKLDKDQNIGSQEAQKDLWNQPYAYTMLELNEPVPNKPYPWDISFGKMSGSLLSTDASTSPFGAANSAPTGDNKPLSTRGYDSTVWPKLGAFGTALTYYHNPNHWAEVPNMWNPYWRAKLEDPTDSPGSNGPTKDPGRDLKDNLSGDDLRAAKDMGYTP